MFQQEQRLLDDGDDVRAHLVTALLGAREIEQPVDDAPAPLHLGIDDVEVLLLGLPFRLGQIGDTQAERLAAREDRRERVVDLVHDAGRELADGGELLTLRQALLGLAPCRHVLADRDDVRNVLVVEPHRDLRNPVMPRVAGRLRVHFNLLDLTGFEDAVELLFQQVARLAVENLEDLAAQRVLARHPLRARFALAVPGPDPVIAIDHVQADRQRIDDAGHEVVLRFELAGPQGDFRRQVLRQLGRGEDRSQHLRHHDQHVVRHALVATLRDDHLEATERLVFMDERQAQQRAAGDRFLVRSLGDPAGDGGRESGELCFVFRAGDGEITGAVRGTEPQVAAAQRQAAPQHAHHSGQPLFCGPTGSQHFSDFGEDLEAGMVRGQRRCDHRVANLGTTLPPRQRRLSTQRQ